MDSTADPVNLFHSRGQLTSFHKKARRNLARVRVSVPATVNSFGQGVNCIALALRLYETVELAEIEAGFSVEIRPARTQGDAEHARAAIIETVRAVCHKTGSTPSGLRAAINQENLAGRGLGLSPGLQLGCAIATNALCGGPLGRDEILGLVLGLRCNPAPAIASLHGNLAIATDSSPDALHAIVPLAPQEIVVIAPRLSEDADADHIEPGDTRSDAITALLVDALRTGNHTLLHELSTHLIQGRDFAPGFSEAIRAAAEAGASAVFVHELELSAVAFARSKHEQISLAMADAFRTTAGLESDVWIVRMETHGISIDAVDISASAQKPPVPASKRPIST